jgi:hypothetical protein
MTQTRHYNPTMHAGAIRIRKARQAAKLTLERVAKEFGHGRAWLAKKELGWNRLNAAEVEVILQVISMLSASS